MAIIPFKTKTSEVVRSKQNEESLISRIVDKVVSEVRLYIPAPIPGEKGEKGDKGEQGEKGERGEMGERGERGVDGLNGRDGKDGQDGKDAVIDLEIIKELVEPQIARIKNEIKRLGIQRGGGGGNAVAGSGHTIQDEGTASAQRTKLNFVGAGVTVTDDAGNDATVVTIPLGSGTGISRSIVVTVGNTTLGASAATDYVCIVTGAHTITLPTAVANTNKYTVKNTHSVAITLDTTSSQTIDGTTSIQIAPEDSVDIIGDSANWFVI